MTNITTLHPQTHRPNDNNTPPSHPQVQPNNITHSILVKLYVATNNLPRAYHVLETLKAKEMMGGGMGGRSSAGGDDHALRVACSALIHALANQGEVENGRHAIHLWETFKTKCGLSL